MLIREIVDRCRVWESHSNSNNRGHVTSTWTPSLTGTGTRPVRSVSAQPIKPVDPVVAVGEIPPVELTTLEAFLQMLLLSVPAQAAPPRPIPGEMESILKHLLLTALVPAPTPRSAVTGQETGPRHLLPPGTLGIGMELASNGAPRPVAGGVGRCIHKCDFGPGGGRGHWGHRCRKEYRKSTAFASTEDVEGGVTNEQSDPV